ncbi:MAG: PIN domain-containing protein [Deltaproteobacteria bacterium]|nr:PIN domain-containing protein [Deltaproteobacteria bacterium]
MTGKIFVDTNLWIYMHSKDPKQEIIAKLVKQNFLKIVISVQVVGEIYHTLTRKGIKSAKEAKSILQNVASFFPPVSITQATVERAIDISIKSKFTYWDSLIIASSLESGCVYLYSEDMNHGQIINETLTIINPFK